VLAGAFCVFAFGFKEEEEKDVGKGPAEDGVKRDGGAYLPRELKIFAVSGFVMAIGSGLSHGFITPLFFVKKFGADQATVSIILTLHRLSFGVPMIFADKVLAYLRRFRRKSILIALMLYQGVTISLCAYLPDIVSATIVFVSHDLLAAAFWIPVLSVLIQGFCREGRRGADSNKVGSIGSIGGIGAPFLAGVLASIDIGYPFLASGLFYVAAALILLPI
jgi:MFS family permease